MIDMAKVLCCTHMQTNPSGAT